MHSVTKTAGLAVLPITGVNMKKILLTGGGSAGHVTPNIALLPALRERGFEIHYVGQEDGIEHKLIEKQKDVIYHSIEAGKLRRYFSLKNLTDPMKVLKGKRQAKEIIKAVKPDVVFSKGGFVSVPVVMAARGICPVICHESDYTPGLANKIASRFADKVLVTFEDTLRFAKPGAIHTGTPIRRELFDGKRARGLEFLGFDGSKPIIIVMGGSLGAAAINDAVRKALYKLTKQFDIVHLCGKGKMDETICVPGYKQYEYINEELPDVMAAADFAVSRSGANALFEFMALNKPAIFVPLPKGASRGDQILNAQYVERKGYAKVLYQEELTADSLCEKITELRSDANRLIENMKKDSTLDGTDEVLEVIDALADGKKI